MPYSGTSYYVPNSTPGGGAGLGGIEDVSTGKCSWELSSKEHSVKSSAVTLEKSLGITNGLELINELIADFGVSLQPGPTGCTKQIVMTVAPTG